MIRIGIISARKAHKIYLETVAQSDPYFACQGIFATAKSAIEQIPLLKPDIILMDPDLPDMDGLECYSHIRRQVLHTKFIICSAREEGNRGLEAMQTGADAYFSMTKGKAYQLIDFIKDVHVGERPVSSSLVSNICQLLLAGPEINLVVKDHHNLYNLSCREKETLQLLNTGLGYRAISQKMCISLYTLKWHIHNIYKKLEVTNRTEALNLYFNKFQHN